MIIRMKDVSWIAGDTTALLVFFQCGHAAKQPYWSLSQGEKQKVLFARALIQNPPVFTHVLLLRKGEAHSQGRTREVLTKKNLTDFFEILIHVRWRKARAWVRMIS
jgi:iron complex transport system ATP-binding protein